jgi:two-component system cell cycle sensor histidine kinase/response regulator CckA
MLAGGYVHDINNLLTVIEGGALLAAEELSVEHVAQEHLSAVRQSAITAGAMSRRLLGFVRRQPMVAEPLDLCSFCRDGVPLFGRLLGSRIWLQVECQPELWQVRADRLQVEQLLMNLLVNARDAMPEGGMVQVVAHNLLAGEPEGLLPGDYVCIEVRDTGVGIDPAIRERLFEPFATSKGPGKGVGLGLATCNHIVSELGGAIGVESELGVGTSFRVYLPRYVAD